MTKKNLTKKTTKPINKRSQAQKNYDQRRAAKAAKLQDLQASYDRRGTTPADEGIAAARRDAQAEATAQRIRELTPKGSCNFKTAAYDIVHQIEAQAKRQGIHLDKRYDMTGAVQLRLEF